MKRLIAATLVLITFSASAQTLFYVGKDSVSVKEFMQAYQRNNPAQKTEKALQEYLDLYIGSRLKVAEAKALGMDTLPQLVSDLQSLRLQILPSYLSDKESINKMTDEAFLRSQKDIHLAHIFIANDGSGDLATRVKLVQDALKKGESFSDLAKKYSADPSAKDNGGDLGWITVFNLPYELENLAYQTKAGQVSVPYQSKAGYHIFKNLGERKAIGRIKAAQILLAFPPDATDESKKQIKKLADSLYTRIQKKDDFGKLAAAFSNDVMSAASNGQMIEFGIGQYDPVFEKTVYTLKDGAISKPFLTTHGYHIVKRMSSIPIPATKDEKYMEALRSRVENSDRLAFAKDAFNKKLRATIKVTDPSFEFPAIWTYSDSMLNNQSPRTPLVISRISSLFKVNDKDITAGDWITYAQTYRYKTDGTGMKSYPVLWEEFINAKVLDYYKDHLEEYNPDFRNQITEFREGNLFFEIMQQKVWGPAQTDTVALKKYYDENRSRYVWKNSADAVIFYATDGVAAITFGKELKKDPSNWKSLVSSMSDKIAGDSGRFEFDQIPNDGNKQLAKGMITNPLINPTDKTVSFAYIVKTYPNPEPRSFATSKGLVINDYQAELEKAWIAELKKKYPVRMNDETWRGLLK